MCVEDDQAMADGNFDSPRNAYVGSRMCMGVAITCLSGGVM